MKKRVLSFLLLLAMLVTMIPVMASGASADTGDEDVPRSEVEDRAQISSFYELYKTENLIAFFDAIDPNNGTLDLANGKWYARVYNAETGKFEVSDTLYATIKGTGWEAYESGFGYADPSYERTENLIEFDKRSLLQNLNSPAKEHYAAWTVDALLRVDLRQVAGAEEAKASVDGAFLFGSLSATHATNLATGKAGKVTWTAIHADGVSAATIVSDGTSFVSNNGLVTPLVVSKIAETKYTTKYTVTHGAVTATSAAVESGSYPETAFHILKNEQGAVYTLRVYGSSSAKEALTAKEAAANATVDAMIRLDVSLDLFNELVALGDGAVERFLSETAPAELVNADKAAYELRLEEAIAHEQELLNIKQLNKYEQLYVGADGSETANGGHLLSLFNANGLGVDLENGIWINKLGDVNATFGNAAQNVWAKRDDGSVGFTGLYGMFDASGKLMTTSSTNNIATNGASPEINTRLNFARELLPNEDFTIEYVAKYQPIYVGDPNAEDKIARDGNGDPIEYYKANNKAGIGAQYTAPIDYIGLISSWTVSRDGIFQTQMPSRGDVIWMISTGTPSWGFGTAWVGSKAFTGGGGMLAQGIRDYGKVHTYVYTRDENSYENSEREHVVDATYAILRDGVSFAKQALSTANLAAADKDGDGKPGEGEDWGSVYYDNDTAGKFYLSSSLPTDFYAVRIYDAVLTEKELALNAFIDIAAHANADLSEFNSITDQSTRDRIVSAMVGLGFTSDPLEFAANYAEVNELYANRVTSENTLYVQDGLRVLTTAYAGLDTGSLVAAGTSISWFNAARDGEMVTLRGAEWTRRANSQGAGYYILKQYTQMQTAAARSFGIYLDASMLPEGDYTIELIVNPTGIIEYKEDGSYERYIDRSTTYGIHYENGFMIGPLRCLIFPSASDGGSQRAALEKRWCYDRGNECWNNTTTRNHKTTENAWKLTSLNDIVSYGIDYQVNKLTGKGEYTIYNDQTKVAAISIKPEDLISNADANNAFQMMVGMPCGVFSVRVYDRMLTEAEKLQNHAADIIYHYNLDTTLLDKLKGIFADDPTVIYRGLSDLSFDMPRDEAQELFDARLSALWLSFDGVAVRNDYTEGLRYYFTLDETTATAMLAAGYQIEVGAIANIGREAIPTLEGHNYDYKIKAYDGLAGRNTGFFIDKNTFAVTVMAESSSKDAMLTKLNVMGYIRLIAPSGEEMIFYVDTPYNDYNPDSFFSIYTYMKKNSEVIKDDDLIEHLEYIADGCYEREYVYVTAGAADGGNGTKGTPYNDFATAFAAAKQRLLDINIPTYLYVYAAAGVYEIHELLSIDGSEIPYEHSYLIIASADGKGTLTTTRKIDSSDFLEAENNIWFYQFAADADGNYPNIRYIYVNGKVADIAHNGANSFLIADEKRYMTRFYRWDNGPWLNAKAAWEEDTLKPDTLFYPLHKVDLNTRFAHYRDQYLVYDAIRAYKAAQLTPLTAITAENVSSYYVQRFEEVKFKKVVYNEISDLYYSDEADESLEKTGTLLETYTSRYTEDSLLGDVKAEIVLAQERFDAELAAFSAATPIYNEALATYLAAVAAYEQAMVDYTEGSDEYLTAVAVYEAAVVSFSEAQATYDAVVAAKDAAATELSTLTSYYTEGVQTLARYNGVLEAAKKKVAPLLKNKTALSKALTDYALTNPNNDYPTASEVVDTENPYKWPAAPSTGIYDTVTELHKAGLLTHASTCVEGDKHLAQELQYNYYRDAYLALDDVNALMKELGDEEPDLNTVAPDVEGSAQYKSLFKLFFYRTVAVEELGQIAFDAALRSPTNNTVTSWNAAPVAVATTGYKDAPADYVKIFTTIRDELLCYYTGFGEDTLKTYLPTVKETDAPYEGKVPYSTGIDDYKIYLNKELVGDQSFAMTQGRENLASNAAALINNSYAAYTTAYDKLASLQKQYEDLVNQNLTNEAKSISDLLVAARRTAKEAYEYYLSQVKLASRYLSDEYSDSFILAESGIQLSVPTEWTYNVVSLMGVDYDDYVMYGDEIHVAMYCDPNNPFSIHNENHVKNRMVSLSSSHAYLDKNNEYYYNRATGILYYYNTEGVEDLSFEYPTMNNMFYITNIKNMIFEDIAFTGLDYSTMNKGFTGGQASSDTNVNCVGENDIMPSGAAIYGKMIRGIIIRNCNFHDLGCEGISFRGRVENTTVEGNSFTNIGSGAIRFGGGTASTAVWSAKEGTENCVITNNYLNNIAIYIYCSPAITTQFSKDLECSYNTILNCSYSGYSIGWSWSWASFMYGDGIKLMHVDIHHNYIASHMQQMGDGGAIYTLGGNAVKEEHTLFNWCHDNYLMMTNTTGDGEGRFAAANYHDGSSSNWETYNTVVAAYSKGAAYAKDSFGHTTTEELSDTEFASIDTPFSKDEYLRRLRNNYNRYWAYYEQTLDSAQAFNITLRDNFLLNVRSTKNGVAQGSMFFEAYRNGVTAEDFIFVENMTYVSYKDLKRLPRRAEDIIYEAGCDWAKADPYDVADNNY